MLVLMLVRMVPPLLLLEEWQASDVVHRARQIGDENAEGMDRNLELALFTVGVRLEAIGYMVFERYRRPRDRG
jgi:hypothetical protein